MVLFAYYIYSISLAISKVDGLGAARKIARFDFPTIGQIEYSSDSLSPQKKPTINERHPPHKKDKPPALRDLDRILFALSQGPKSIREISDTFDFEVTAECLNGWRKSVNNKLKTGKLKVFCTGPLKPEEADPRLHGDHTKQSEPEETYLGFLDFCSKNDGYYGKKFFLTIPGIMLALHRFSPDIPNDNDGFSKQNCDILDNLAENYKTTLPRVFGKWDALKASPYVNIFEIFKLVDPSYIIKSSYDMLLTNNPQGPYDRLEINASAKDAHPDAGTLEAAIYLELLKNRPGFNGKATLKNTFPDNPEIREYCRYITDLEISHLRRELCNAESRHYSRTGNFKKGNKYAAKAIKENRLHMHELELSDIAYCKWKQYPVKYLRELSVAVYHYHRSDRDTLMEELPCKSEEDLDGVIASVQDKINYKKTDIIRIMSLKDKPTLVDSIFCSDFTLRDTIEKLERGKHINHVSDCN